MDWSQLSPDLLAKIAGKLSEVADLVRFRAACSAWRSAAALLKEAAQPPWLLLPSESSACRRRFFSLSEGRAYTLPLPESRGKRLLGSSAGWILAIDPDLSASLLNPLTRASLPLPSLAASRICSCPEATPLFFSGSVSPDPPAASPLVVASCRIYSRLSFCRPGDAAWTPIDAAGRSEDCAYHAAKFFVLRNAGSVDAVDAAALSVAYTIPGIASPRIPDPTHRSPIVRRLVESSGDLLMVTWPSSFCLPDEYPMHSFRVFRLGRPDEEPRWTETTSIGDSALFVDNSHVFSFDARGSGGRLRRNCVYAVCNKLVRRNGSSGPADMYGVYAYDLEDRSKELLPCDLGCFPVDWKTFPPSWIVPSLR